MSTKIMRPFELRGDALPPGGYLISKKFAYMLGVAESSTRQQVGAINANHSIDNIPGVDTPLNVQIVGFQVREDGVLFPEDIAKWAQPDRLLYVAVRYDMHNYQTGERLKGDVKETFVFSKSLDEYLKNPDPALFKRVMAESQHGQLVPYNLKRC